MLSDFDRQRLRDAQAAAKKRMDEDDPVMPDSLHIRHGLREFWASLGIDWRVEK